MTEPLTPWEHADVRDLLLAGTERMKPSEFRRGLIPAAIAVVLVAGIVGATVIASLDGGTGQPATPAPTGTSTIEPQSQIPAPCMTYAESDMDNAPGGDVIAVAGSATDLGRGVVLSPGILVVESTDTPGTFDATAAVCGDLLTRDALVAAATAIAKAIYADPAHADLSVLTVAAWSPISSDAIAQQDATLSPISTEYRAHDWDASADILVTAWTGGLASCDLPVSECG